MSEPFRRSRSKGVGYDCTSWEGSFVGGMGQEEGGKEEMHRGPRPCGGWDLCLGGLGARCRHAGGLTMYWYT